MKIAAGHAPMLHPEKLQGGAGTLKLAELMDPAMLRGAGRRVALLTIPSGCSIGEHQHTGECEGFYVLQGEGVYTDNEETYSITPGDFVLCRDGERHAVRNEQEQDLELFILILNTVLPNG